MDYALIVFQLSGNGKLRGGQEAIDFVLYMLMDQWCITVPYQF